MATIDASLYNKLVTIANNPPTPGSKSEKKYNTLIQLIVEKYLENPSICCTIDLAVKEVIIYPTNDRKLNSSFLAVIIGNGTSATVDSLLKNGFRQALNRLSIDQGLNWSIYRYNELIKNHFIKNKLSIQEQLPLDIFKKHILIWEHSPALANKTTEIVNFFITYYSTSPLFSRNMLGAIFERFHPPRLADMKTELDCLFDEIGLIQLLSIFHFEPKKIFTEVIDVDPELL